MRQRAVPVAFVFISSLILPAIAAACGISMVPSPSASGWDYGNDSSEQSYIHYDKGVEDLIISRNFSNENTNTVWVIPLPARADDVDVDVLTEVPSFNGYDVTLKAKDDINAIRKVLTATQIWPIIPYFLLANTVSFGIEKGLPVPGATTDAIQSIRDDVTVFEHIEKNGMTAEVLSAVSSDALYTYLREKGLNVQRDSITVLQSYIGKNFTFIATWVSPTADAVAAKGVRMHFPTDRIFYPLKPESGTPGEGLPETITIVGHVTPELFAGIKDSTHVDYYTSYGGSTLEGFFSTTSAFDYTKVVINTAPRNLTHDLYLTPHAPLRVSLAKYISAHPVLVFIIELLFVSFVATVVLSKMLFMEYRMSTVVKITLASCLSLIGTSIGAVLFLKERKVTFIILFSLTFIAAAWFVGWLLTIAVS